MAVSYQKLFDCIIQLPSNLFFGTYIATWTKLRISSWKSRWVNMEKDLTQYQPIIAEIKGIISAGRQNAYSAANTAMLMTYWSVGKRIVEQEQAGAERAAYGKGLIHALSNELTKDFGKGYSERNLRNFRKFYQMFPDLTIWQTRLPNLT